MAKKKKTLRVGMIGYKFMGKAHSNAWLNANKFFDLPAQVEMAAVCGRNRADVEAMADNWGWESVETDYRKLLARDDIDVIDIATPNNLHADMAIAAARAGKAVICEKPLAMSHAEAKKMAAAVKKAKVPNMVWYNYRRVPALGLARQLVKEGRIGRLFHVRARYLQDWMMDPATPLIWRLDAKVAGSGAHGDINAHIIDAARFITGEEMTEVSGMMETFIKERARGEMAGGLTAKTSAGRKKMGRVTVDDTVLFMARFQSGAVGSFEASRYAHGHKNSNCIELNGSKGALRFDFQNMNELEYFDGRADQHVQGWTLISATEPAHHPYAHAWWPPGHIIGYGNTFVNQVADFVTGVARRRKLSPDFAEAARTQAVLEAVSKSVKQRSWVKVPK